MQTVNEINPIYTLRCQFINFWAPDRLGDSFEILFSSIDSIKDICQYIVNHKDLIDHQVTLHSQSETLYKTWKLNEKVNPVFVEHHGRRQEIIYVSIVPDNPNANNWNSE